MKALIVKGNVESDARKQMAEATCKRLSSHGFQVLEVTPATADDIGEAISSFNPNWVFVFSHGCFQLLPGTHCTDPCIVPKPSSHFCIDPDGVGAGISVLKGVNVFGAITCHLSRRFVVESTNWNDSSVIGYDGLYFSIPPINVDVDPFLDVILHAVDHIMLSAAELYCAIRQRYLDWLQREGDDLPTPSWAAKTAIQHNLNCLSMYA